MGLEAGVMHRANLLPRRAPGGDGHRVLVVPLYAHGERLQPALEQPGRERIGRLSPEQHLLFHFVDVRRGSADDSAEHVMMAVQILGRRMDHDVGAKLQWPQIDRAREGRVDDEGDARLRG